MTLVQPEKQSNLKPHHYGAMLAVGAVGGIIAYLLFHFIIGIVFRVVEIVVVVAVIMLLVRFVFKKATDR